MDFKKFKINIISSFPLFAQEPSDCLFSSQIVLVKKTRKIYKSKIITRDMESSPHKFPYEGSEQLLVKSDATTDPEYGREPSKRDIPALLEYGVINLDKPSGPTSHEVVSWVRKILKIEKSGHGGTLDPHVTGVLPCALGKATRVLSALLTAGKEYVGVMVLHDAISQKEVDHVFKLFQGKLYQRPPMRSSVARRLRVREIYYDEVMEMNERKQVLFRLGCEAGTYVRKFCFDIGEALCSGAHMVELRRTRVGEFREDHMLITLQDLKDAFTLYHQEGEDKYLKAFLQPMERMVDHLPKIHVRDTAVDALCHGADLAAAGVCNVDARIEPDRKSVV